jgi:hypothetical protein
MKRSLLKFIICSFLISYNLSVRLFSNLLQIQKNDENTPSRKVNSLSENSLSTTTKFQDVINEIKTIKIELFGNSEENMDFYKRNKNAYDPKLIYRLTKIAKILELEELLDFYNSNKKRNSADSITVHQLNITENKENNIKLDISNIQESDRKDTIINQNQKSI